MNNKLTAGIDEAKVISGSQYDKKDIRHPADVAGKTRYDYFQTDLWLIGGKEYQTPKNSIPQVLEAAFAPTKASQPAPISMNYNREKFTIDRLTGLTEGREYIAWVNSVDMQAGVVDITLRKDTFVVKLFKGAHEKRFPFTKEEFLNALLAGKVNVELDQLEHDSESESETPSR